MSSGDKYLMVMGAIFGVFLLAALSSLFATFMWYCFDDALAALVGVPEIGNVAWYHVWPATMFVAALFKASLREKGGAK